ncbi:sulfite reductase (NADPH) flavoprotein alpha-component [Rhodoblastus acidophilus]|uniref:PepSY domain-containing protein n=1 Tax=Rhodoblastus acidophilus TaxID=1074 RepID=UPI002225B5AF|nr:PepSY domain-containing protein [Rhodoblastus acidophilus]MCW2285993.1 sulfite reductase (NADPH) flavoprotein alpha-component [Rhodoblastus acidophilus]MCW2334887.1 sulfite reductase (NADPH) flavoprotein alpha-component [Rhodoblastus acidophilus]
MRRLHAVAAAAVALLLIVVASTGALLSLQPALNRVAYPAVTPGVSVAQLADAVAARHVRVDAIRIGRDGAATATFNDGAGRETEVIDPRSGAGLGAYTPSAFFRFVADLHRSLLMGEGGRVAVALTALGLLALCLSGFALLARSLGGAAKMFRPIRGDRTRRLHGEIGRFALTGLLVSSLTGALLAAITFDLIPSSDRAAPDVSASGGKPAPIRALSGLAAVDVVDLKALKFAGASGVFQMRSDAGEATVDAANGAVLSFVETAPEGRMEQWALALHGAHGLWAFALMLGLCSAGAPVLGATGFLLWRRRRGHGVGVQENAPAEDADTIVFVGSENNATWGFARALARALAGENFRVHVAAMNEVGPCHVRAKRWLVLTSTYGDGAAPASAQKFLERLARLEGRIPVAVLGFGDRNFPQFCGYAQRVAEMFDERGWASLLPMKRIDRRSPQEFAQWARGLGDALGCALVVEHIAERPGTQELELIGRDLYGEAVGAPVAILRFAAPDLPDFEAGDLLAVQPPDGDMPRFYSLASSTRDGMAEICVRLQHGGLCSTFLHGLAPGDRIAAFVRHNPAFRPAQGVAPLILIGAGAGIAPLAGFVRANRDGRPVHLYWGGRSPASDFLYEHELAQSLAERRLTCFRPAFSRCEGAPAYVQDRVAADAHSLRALIAEEAQILVCGGRDMAQAVRETLDRIVRPLGLDLATLRSHGRYLEDVF